MENLTQKAIELANLIWPKLLLATITLVVGLYLIKFATKLLCKVFEKTNFDESLEKFILSLVSIGLKVVLFVSVAGMLGFETTGIIAMLGAMAFAVGMALQGSLSNFAGGVLLLIFKPFKVGDYIEAQGHSGKVVETQIFQTILTTSDNKKVIIPNGALLNDSILNYSAMSTRRLDLVFGIGYDDSIKDAKNILQNLVKTDSRILTDPAPLIAVGNLGDSAVDIYCRIWVKTSDYSSVKFDFIETVKLTFDEKGISIPFPQQDIHLIK